MPPGLGRRNAVHRTEEEPNVEHEQHPRLTSTTQQLGTSAEKETRDEERRHTEETTRDTHKIKNPGGKALSGLYLPRPPPLPLCCPVPYTAYTV